MKRILCLLAASALAACSSDVKVGMTKLHWPGEKISGHYAATVQTGAWRKDVEAEGFPCVAWSFPTDADEAYASAMKDAMSSIFERVTFTPEMSPPDLGAAGYDGAVIVYQGAFETSALAREEPYWTYSAHASVELGAIVALIRPEGLAGQASPQGSGVSGGQMRKCGELGGRIARASRMAILGLVQNAVAETRKMVAAKQLHPQNR